LAKRLKSRKDGRSDQEIVDELYTQLFRELAACDDHIETAKSSYGYYYATQEEFGTTPEDFQIIINTVRPDVDHKVAKLLDSEPEGQIRGRGGEDWEEAQIWNDLVSYSRECTGDRHDSWDEIVPKVVYQAKQIGEGMAYVGYDPSEENGWGMVVNEWINSLYCVWDQKAKSAQLRDARWVILLVPREIREVGEQYPELKGKLTESQDESWLAAGMGTGGLDISGWDDEEGMQQEAGLEAPRPLPAPDDEPQVFEVRRWMKKRIYGKRYRERDTGKPAFLTSDEGQPVPMTQKEYKQLPEELQAEFDELDASWAELWETVAIGKHLLRHDLSDLDQAKGGCGQYPFARLSNIWDPRVPKGHGDIEFQQGYEELLCQMATRWIESMFIANAQFLDVVKGALPPSEEHKLEFIGRRPYQSIQRYPGMPRPEFVNSAPTQANLLAAGHNFVRELASQSSQVYDINRGGMPYQTSGRGIRQLIAEAAVTDTLDRRRMESFLRQETYLRISLMQQYMTSYRMAQVVSKLDNDTYWVFIGDTEERTKAFFGLEQLFPKDKQGEPDFSQQPGVFQTQDGKKGKILAIKKREVGDFDLRIVLDSGRERTKAERMDLVEMFAQFATRVPPPVVQWAGELLEVPRQEMLMEGLKQANQQTQMMDQMDQVLRQSGLSMQELGQLAQQVGQRRQQLQPGSNGQADAAEEAQREELLV